MGAVVAVMVTFRMLILIEKGKGEGGGKMWCWCVCVLGDCYGEPKHERRWRREIVNNKRVKKPLYEVNKEKKKR